MFITNRKATIKSMAWISGLIMLSLLMASCQSAEDEDQDAVINESGSEGLPAVEAAEAPAEDHNSIESDFAWKPVIQEFDGVDMAIVPAGCFMMGDPDLERAGPAHEVYLTEPYWIHVTEVSNDQFQKMGGQAGQDPSFPGQDISAGELPRTGITWEEAAAFCQSRGARLTTEAEWEYAARGPEGWVYPWGDEFDPTRLNYCAQNCPIRAANSGAYYSNDDGYAVAAPVISIPEGASWVGALNMAGNVAEWVNDWFDPDYYSNSLGENPAGPDSGQSHVVKSMPWSWWLDPELNAQTANRWDFVPDSTSKNFSGTTGFRCVRDATG